MAFVPDRMTVQRGDRIVFHNDDAISHQVIIMGGAGGETSLPKQRAGEVAILVLPDAGTVGLGCDFHPMMRLTVTVN